MNDDWIRKLLLRFAFSNQTQTQYATCLRYWNDWYRLRYNGNSLPLADDPPSPISPGVWEDFKADHSAVVVNGLIKPAMGVETWNKLQQRGFNRTLLGISELAACWKMKVLSSLQRKLGFNTSLAQLKELREQVKTSWIAAKATVGVAEAVSLPTTHLVEQFRRACPDTRDGVRAAALVTLLQHLSARQVTELKFGDLAPIDLIRDQSVTRVIDLTIHHPRDDFQRSEPVRRIQGNDAAAVYLWGAVRLMDTMGIDCDCERPPDDTLYFVWENARTEGSVPITRYWLSNTMRQLALWSGIYCVHRRAKYSAEAIRSGYALETRNQQKCVQIAQRADLRSTKSVMRILRRRQSQCGGPTRESR